MGTLPAGRLTSTSSARAGARPPVRPRHARRHLPGRRRVAAHRVIVVDAGAALTADPGCRAGRVPSTSPWRKRCRCRWSPPTPRSPRSRAPARKWRSIRPGDTASVPPQHDRHVLAAAVAGALEGSPVIDLDQHRPLRQRRRRGRASAGTRTRRPGPSLVVSQGLSARGCQPGVVSQGSSARVVSPGSPARCHPPLPVARRVPRPAGRGFGKRRQRFKSRPLPRAGRRAQRACASWPAGRRRWCVPWPRGACARPRPGPPPPPRPGL